MRAPNLISAWRYRHFILSSIQTDFRSRFARSKLGGMWIIIHPLAQAAIFALILAGLMSARLPGMVDSKFAYAEYLMAGMAAWSLFAEIVTRCSTIFIDNANLLKKVAFPRINLPLIVIGSALINNLLLLASVLAVMAFLGHMPGLQLAWLPLLIVLNLALALGMGLLLGIFNVFVRDIGQVVPIALQIGFWFTPIVYTPNVLPASLRDALPFNPLATVVQGVQNVMLYDRPPDLHALFSVFVLACLLLFVALVVFRRASSDLADAL